MKKFLCVLIAITCFVFPISAFAENEELTISAPSGILVDTLGRVLYEKNADNKMPIASVTKVMTLNLVFDAIENGSLTLDEKITVSQYASSMGGSQAFIDAGYEYKVSDLIKSIIIASANDASVAIAERISGSVETFVVKMNAKASELGMKNTCFKNCTGLPAKDHYSTARDVSIMSRELLKHEDYFIWSSTWMDKLMHEKDGRITELVNTNKLIRSLSGCDGLKTGSTSEAGFCVTTTAKRGGQRLVSVILGGETSALRFEDAAKLINYGFANFESRQIVVAGQTQDEKVKLLKGCEEEVELIALSGINAAIKNDQSDKIEITLELPETVEAPIASGQIIGYKRVFVNGEEIAKIPLAASKDYRKATFIDKLKGILNIDK